VGNKKAFKRGASGKVTVVMST